MHEIKKKISTFVLGKYVSSLSGKVCLLPNNNQNNINPIIVIMSAFPPSNTFLCRLRSLIIPLKDYKEIYY